MILRNTPGWSGNHHASHRSSLEIRSVRALVTTDPLYASESPRAASSRSVSHIVRARFSPTPEGTTQQDKVCPPKTVIDPPSTVLPSSLRNMSPTSPTRAGPAAKTMSRTAPRECPVRRTPLQRPRPPRPLYGLSPAQRLSTDARNRPSFGSARRRKAPPCRGHTSQIRNDIALLRLDCREIWSSESTSTGSAPTPTRIRARIPALGRRRRLLLGKENTRLAHCTRRGWSQTLRLSTPSSVRSLTRESEAVLREPAASKQFISRAAEGNDANLILKGDLGLAGERRQSTADLVGE